MAASARASLQVPPELTERQAERCWRCRLRRLTSLEHDGLARKPGENWAQDGSGCVTCSDEPPVSLLRRDGGKSSGD